jgi:D-3-phosphoglycerate dehydrogenase / 2-oxoglutarate reductase
MTRVLATDPVPELARQAFSEIGSIELDAEAEAEARAVAQVLIVRSGRVDRQALERFPHLRVIARTGVGIDNVDLRAASSRGVAVLYAPGAGARPIAEGALALMLAAAKRLRALGELVSHGRWDERYEHPGLDLHGATLGIVGLGRIGGEVAALAGALGMRVLAYEPSPRAEVLEMVPQVQLVKLAELMRSADVISLHCDLNDATRGIIDAGLLAQVKQGAILVNVARGGVIENEQMLLDALDSGRLSAVALDVYSREPPEHGSALLSDPRVICTPHSIGLTQAWNERVFSTLASDTLAVLQGGRPMHIANPEVLPLSAGARG